MKRNYGTQCESSHLASLIQIPLAKCSLNFHRLKLVTLARRRAEVDHNLNMSTGEAPSDDNLEELQAGVEDKKEEIKHLLERAIAVGWICERHFEMVSSFLYRWKFII